MFFFIVVVLMKVMVLLLHGNLAVVVELIHLELVLVAIVRQHSRR